jgi:hypothetical protein
MKLKKPLLIASLSAALALGAVSTKANAADPVLGALIGGGIGAAIGHDVNRHGGAAVGGVIGAVVGSSIAQSSNYYNDGYYGDRYYAPAPSYGYYSAPAPAYGYVAPPPAYYAAPAIGATFVYSSGPRYYGHRHYYRGGHRHW